MTKRKTDLTPEQRIKELEQQLADTKLKADFFEVVVKVIENDYGVRLSKKRKGTLSGKGGTGFVGHPSMLFARDIQTGLLPVIRYTSQTKLLLKLEWEFRAI